MQARLYEDKQVKISKLTESGLLGIVDVSKHFTSSAQNLATATAHIVERACSSFDRGWGQTVHHDLVAHVMAHVEVFTADAAADEQLCGRILKGRRLGDALVELPTFPSLKLVVKDKSHAARRLSSRGWKCDPFLHAVSSEWIMNKSSPTQLIRHSIGITAVFTDLCNKRAQAGRSILDRPRLDTAVDLRAAKHRFETHQKPFGRFTIHYPDLLLTLERVSFGRHGATEARQKQIV